MNNETALLVIDAQVNMFAPDNAVYASERLLKTLGSLIARARSAHIPIVYVQNNGGSGDPDQPGTPGWQIHPALIPSERDTELLPAIDVIAHHNAILTAFATVVEADAIDLPLA